MKRLLIVILLGLQAWAVDENAIVNGWLANQTNIQSWSATFKQTRTIKALAQPLVSTGRIWFAAPQNFRWELGTDQTIAIRSNETMLVIYPKFQRAEKYDFENAGRSEWKDALALLQSGFPRSREQLDEQFDLLSVGTNQIIELNLQPKSSGARKLMPQINLLLTTNLLLAGTELVFADGSRMRNEFGNARTNVDVAGRFNLTIPPEFELVEPMKGKAR
ncbi:MAG TPA: outer-membrane lipoprotein carrier protein LolA [Verrucomicrobiae bacterium]